MVMFEVNAKTVDLNAFMMGMSAKQRVRSHFIWIGVLAVDSPKKIKMQRYNDSQMIILPPQLNGHSDNVLISTSGIMCLRRRRTTTRMTKTRTTKMSTMRRLTAKVMLTANTTPAH
jgi:hypothetical protein